MRQLSVSAVTQLKEKIPNLSLLIIGEGPERAAVGRQVADAGPRHAACLAGWRRDTMTLTAADAVT